MDNDPKLKFSPKETVISFFCQSNFQEARVCSNHTCYVCFEPAFYLKNNKKFNCEQFKKKCVVCVYIYIYIYINKCDIYIYIYIG